MKELFEYNREVRHRYFEAMAGLSWEELVADRGASFHSIRSIFVHTLSAIDYWMDLLLGEQVHSHRDYGEYRSIREVKEYMEWVEARVDRYLSGLTPEGLLAEHVVGGSG